MQISATVLTHSVGSLLGIAVFGLGVLFFTRRLPWGKLTLGILVSLFIILTGFYLWWRQKNTAYVAESRERIIRKVLLGAFKRPILGWGLANVDYAFESAVWPIAYQHDIYIDKAHGNLLEVFTAAGVAGLSIYLILIIYLGKILLVNARGESEVNWWHKTLFLVFLVYIFHSQTNVTGIAEEVIFWLIAGLAAVSFVRV